MHAYQCRASRVLGCITSFLKEVCADKAQAAEQQLRGCQACRLLSAWRSALRWRPAQGTASVHQASHTDRQAPALQAGKTTPADTEQEPPAQGTAFVHQASHTDRQAPALQAGKTASAETGQKQARRPLELRIAADSQASKQAQACCYRLSKVQGCDCW